MKLLHKVEFVILAKTGVANQVALNRFGSHGDFLCLGIYENEFIFFQSVCYTFHYFLSQCAVLFYTIHIGLSFFVIV